MTIETDFRREVDQPMKTVPRLRHVLEEGGSTLLETALSIMITLIFIFGVMEASFAYYTYHFISNAAREGTRYAIVRGSSAGPACASYSSYACQASKANIKDYVSNLGFSGITPTDVTVTYAGYPAGATCTPLLTCNNPGNLVTVTVQYNFPFTVPFIPAHNYSMMSSSAMVISQ